ncbi:MAG: hypothetical protein ACXWT0_00295 [Methylobacter sp.]
MAEDKEIITRYGKVLYDRNPSLTGEFKMGVKSNMTSKVDDAIVVSQATGEIISTGSFAFIKDEVVDNERFCKLYVDGVAAFTELSPAGKTLFKFIYNEISGLRGKDKDKVDLNYLLAKRWDDKLSKRTYERGMSDLLEKGVIFRTLSSDTYYVNIRFIFNGNRVAVINSYRREDSNNKKEIASE